MEFRTPIENTSLCRPIDHSRQGLALGSCFAELIAGRMRRAKLPIVVNPFGTLYNPMSVADTIETLEAGGRFGSEDLVQCSELWCSFRFHGDFDSPDPTAALEVMNRAVEEGSQALCQADYLIVTFGTAWVYELASSDSHTSKGVVANCHRFPAGMFHRRRLSVQEIVDRYEALLRGPLAGKQLILTVSPVRHLRDGLAGNSLSKATLLVAVHELQERHPEQVDYFPAYEMLIDDLRDYRFYAADMTHPSETAAAYVWEHFAQTALTPRSREAAREAEKIATAAAHRPFNPQTESHRQFLASMADRIRELEKQYPELDFAEESAYFNMTQPK